MLRRALKHATLAVVMLIPTIAGVVAQAPAAHATTTPISGSPFRGGAQVNASYGDTTISMAAWTIPTGTYTCNTSDAYTAADRTNWLYVPGTQVNLCLDWKSQATDGVEDFHWYLATLHIVDPTGTDHILADESNDGTDYGNFNSAVFGAGFFTTQQIYNSGGGAVVGSYRIYLTLLVDANKACGAGDGTYATCDSTGGGSPASFAGGYVDASNGLMAGEDPSSNTTPAASDEAALETDGTYVGKNMPIVREFNASLSAPASKIGTLASHGRLVIYSWAPKNYTPTSGHSAWYDIANGTLDSSLTTWLTTLKNDATASGAPGDMLVTISHEPHDNATDWPTEGTNNNCTVNTTTCFGSVREFRAMLTHLHDLIHTLGFDSVLKTIYIATDNNAVTHGNDGTGTGDYIGGGDTMYPGNTHRTCHLTGSTPDCLASNVDYVGYDLYNYYQYWAGHAPTYHNGTWEPMKDKLLTDDSVHGEGVALVADRIGKQFFLPELGSHPGCINSDAEEGCQVSGQAHSTENGQPATRDDWFNNGVRAIEQSTTVLKWMRGWSYYHKLDAWDWRFMQDSNQTSGTLDTFHQRGTSGWETSVAGNPLFSSTALGV